MKVYEGSAKILNAKPTQILSMVPKMTKKVKLLVKHDNFWKNFKNEKKIFLISAFTNHFPTTVAQILLILKIGNPPNENLAS